MTPDAAPHPTATPSVAEALEAHPFLAGLTAADLALLAPCARLETAAAGTVLAREGLPADAFHLVIDGRIAVEVHAPGTPPAVLATVGRGEVLGWSWRFPPHRWFFDAVALTDTTTARFAVDALQAVLAAHPELDAEITARLGAVVTDRLRDARRQLLDLYGRRS